MKTSQNTVVFCPARYSPDVRYHIICYDLMSLLEGLHAVISLQQDTHILQRITYMLWIAHKLERIGDHCVNICERTIYIVEGNSKCSSQAEAAYG